MDVFALGRFKTLVYPVPPLPLDEDEDVEFEDMDPFLAPGEVWPRPHELQYGPTRSDCRNLKTSSSSFKALTWSSSSETRRCEDASWDEVVLGGAAESDFENRSVFPGVMGESGPLGLNEVGVSKSEDVASSGTICSKPELNRLDTGRSLRAGKPAMSGGALAGGCSPPAHGLGAYKLDVVRC